MNKELLALLERAFGELGAGGKYALGEMAAYYQAQATANLLLWVVLTLLSCVVVFKWAMPQYNLEVTKDREYAQATNRSSSARSWEDSSVFATIIGCAVIFTWIIYTARIFYATIPVVFQPTGYVFDKIISALQ